MTSHDTRAVWVDREDDRERADDGVSRYAVYLRDRPGRFESADGPMGTFTDDPVRFAEACWDIGRPPVMDNPPTRTHPRVISARASRDEWTGEYLLITVEMVSELPAALAYPSMGATPWRGWQQDYPGRYHEPSYGPGAPPHVALPTLYLVVPVPAAQLPAPGPHVDDAFAALEAVAVVVNDRLRPILAALDGGQ